MHNYTTVGTGRFIGAMAQFRETLWFKKGDLDVQAAEQAAAAPDEELHDRADSLPIEDRYNDDGSVSRADTATYGLHTGGTRWLERLRPTGELAADVLVREMKRQRRLYLAMFVATLVVCGALLALT